MDQTQDQRTINQQSCPRCGSLFQCRPDQVENCQCNNIKLSAETTQFLTNTYYDCLCINCLVEINQLTAKAANHAFPVKGDQFQEGIHFYRENGNWVFTEFYHLLRGRCCGSGCRHCAYGFKKAKNG